MTYQLLDDCIYLNHDPDAVLPTKTALLDLDTSMLDFFGSFLPHLNAFSGQNLTVADFVSFNLHDVADITKEEGLHLLRTTPFMLEMEPFARTVEFIKHLRDEGYRIVFSTSRVFAAHCRDHTLMCLTRLGLDFDELHCVVGKKWETKSSPDVQYEIYFDDSPSHIANYINARNLGEEVPTRLFAPRIPYNHHLHEHDFVEYLDLDDHSIDFATIA